jgi:hypothetical protein
VAGDIGVDRFNQFNHIAEHSTSESIDREIPEKSLNHVQPRRARWCEMHMKPHGARCTSDRLRARRAALGTFGKYLFQGEEERTSRNAAPASEPRRLDVLIEESYLAMR